MAGAAPAALGEAAARVPVAVAPAAEVAAATVVVMAAAPVAAAEVVAAGVVAVVEAAGAVVPAAPVVAPPRPPPPWSARTRSSWRWGRRPQAARSSAKRTTAIAAIGLVRGRVSMPSIPFLALYSPVMSSAAPPAAGAAPGPVRHPSGALGTRGREPPGVTRHMLPIRR